MSSLSEFLNIYGLDIAVDRAASGGDPAAIADAVSQFRTDLGGDNNGGEPLSFDDGFRSINWDGIPAAAVDRDPATTDLFLPPNFFNANVSPRARGITFLNFQDFVDFEDGQLRVSAASTDPPTETGVNPIVEFGGINANYPGEFQPFSAERLFAIDGNVVDIFFFVPGTTTPASVDAFGAVFSDVDLPNTTELRLFGINGELLHQDFIQPSDKGLSFQGVTLPEGQEIVRAQLVLGNAAFGTPDNPAAGADVVVLDDLIYSEPQAVTTAPVDRVGNTLATALPIGVLSSPQSFSDFVGTVDRRDLYRFSVDAPSRFNASLTNFNADLDLALVQDLNTNGELDPGEEIIFSDNLAAEDEAIDVQLAAGEYFVEVVSFLGSSEYDLAFSATPGGTIPPDGAGNDLATAANVDLLTGMPTTVRDTIGAFDADDFYRFNIATPANVTLVLDGFTADTDIQLVRDFNNNGIVEPTEILAFSDAAGLEPERIEMTIDPGEYFANVIPFGGDTEYSLTITAV